MSISSTIAAWNTAEAGTQRVAQALPDALGLGHVRDFVNRHPILATAIVLGLAWYVFGGRRPVTGGLPRIGRGQG